MALNEKQRKIFARGMRLRTDRNDKDSKSFLQILDDTLNPTAKNALFAAFKNELVRRNNVRKAAIEKDNTDINS